MFSTSSSSNPINPTPENSAFYSLKRVDGKIILDLPKEIAKAKNIIYMFRDRLEEKVLIGKTGTSLQQRMQRYLSTFNSPDLESESNQDFIAQVRERPSDFEVGIIYSVQSGEDLDVCESRLIEEQSRITKLYNQRKGGGGGLAHTEEEPRLYGVPNDPNLLTPPKYYPFKKIGDRISPDLTPTFPETVKKIRKKTGDPNCPIFYSITHVKKKLRYIGVTTKKDPKIRALEHLSSSKQFDPTSTKFNPKAKSGFLHPALGEDPESFALGIMPIIYSDKENAPQNSDITLFTRQSDVERTIIARKRAFEEGYNCNRGGGGPIASKRIKIVKGS